MASLPDLRAVILAGGSGSRLWPLSRLQTPKQFLRLMGEDTLIEATIRRLEPLVAPSQVLVVTGADAAQGEGYDILERYEKILEPVGRNTAPAIAVAALGYRLRGEDPVMLVLPSDHMIRDVPALHAAMRVAISAAAEGKLVTFGIRPTAPATGFGYIRSERTGAAVERVLQFREKPDAETAIAYLAAGDYWWNSGMFVWKASAILAAVEAALPELAALLERMRNAVHIGLSFADVVKLHLADAPSISIDHGVLEGCANLFLVPGDFGWSDVGSWASVHEIAEHDLDGNSLHGSVIAIDCRNSLIRSESRLVTAVDVADVVIVDTPDALLVARRDASQRVREIVERLSARSAKEHVTPTTVTRPWGTYTVLDEGVGYKIKRIVVRPGGRLSLQSHERRSEHWVVVSGTATVTVDGKETELATNQSTFVPIGARHRLENRASEALQMIEVQVGGYVGEDDIQRYDDVYGRVTR